MERTLPERAGPNQGTGSVPWSDWEESEVLGMVPGFECFPFRYTPMPSSASRFGRMWYLPMDDLMTPPRAQYRNGPFSYLHLKLVLARIR
jgi:hypothetical protein